MASPSFQHLPSIRYGNRCSQCSCNSAFVEWHNLSIIFFLHRERRSTSGFLSGGGSTNWADAWVLSLSCFQACGVSLTLCQRQLLSIWWWGLRSLCQKWKVSGHYQFIVVDWIFIYLWGLFLGTLTEEMLRPYHDQMIEAMERIFENNKAQFGMEKVVLKIIWPPPSSSGSVCEEYFVSCNV